MNFETLKVKALEAGITEIEVYTAKKHGIEISSFNGVIENNTSFTTNVMAIRGVYNHQIVTIYEENCNDDMIPSIIERIKDNCQIKNLKDPFFIYPGDENYPKLEEKACDFDEYTLDDKASLCLKLTKLMEEQSKFVTKTEISYSETENVTTIENSNGLHVSRNSRYAYLVAEVVAEKDGETKTGFDYIRLNQMKDVDLESLAQSTVLAAIDGFGAESIASGSYPVVLDKKVVSNFPIYFLQKQY